MRSSAAAGDRVAVAQAQALASTSVAQVVALVLAVRRRVARDELLAELDLDVAALGDLERGLQRLGPLGERVRHLLVGLEEELVGLEGHLRRGERGLRLHAQQRRVVVVVLAAQVVDVGGGDERAADLAGDPHDVLVGHVLLGDAVLLDLEVDVVGAEDVEQLVDVGAGLVDAAVGQAAGRSAPARQPVSAMMPSAWAASCSRSTVGLPRFRPSRKPSELSLTRLR